ncbi:MAG TPA: YdeI/OmpD-associated family protein [Leifsonia sp.]|jgi:hypothetical protein
MEFTTVLLLGGTTATGIRVPDDVVEQLGGGKRTPVQVTINGVTYPSTIAMMKGEPMIPVSADIRAKAGVRAGDELTVTLVRDDSTRTVEVPEDLAAAIASDEVAQQRFTALSYSNQRRHVLAVTGAKTAETRDRRIAKLLEELRG